MTSYRLHIYGMAQDVVSEAISYLLYYQNNYQYEENLDALRLRAALLSERVESLNSSLPVEVKHGADNRPNMAWVNWSVKERGNVPHLPGNLLDIVKRDIPGLLRIFDEWYERRSLAGADLDDRLRALISGGQLTDALRVSWPFFKTRMARKFSLDEGLDGPKLVDELFGPKGAAAYISQTGRVGRVP